MADSLTYGQVVGRFVAIVGDRPTDLDLYPDLLPLTGTITLTPQVSSTLLPTMQPSPAIALLRPIEAVLDREGYVSLNGKRGVFVLATDNPAFGVSEFTYTVSFDGLRAEGSRVRYQPFSFQVRAGEVVDLSTIAPVPVSEGSVLVPDVERINIQVDAAEARLRAYLEAELAAYDGVPGPEGKSTYQLWLDAGNEGSFDAFLQGLKGAKGDVGGPGVPGEDGADGYSAYETWLAAGNTGNEQQFLASLKGEAGYQPPAGQAIPTVDAITKEFVDPAVIAAILATATKVLRSPGATVDLQPLLQAAIDDKQKIINMSSKDVYYLKDPVFLDSTDPRTTVTINWNNARLDLAVGGGAKASDFTASDIDPDTRFFFFGNTRRTAWNETTGVVTTGESTTATGSRTATVGPSIVMNDLDARGQNQAVRLVHLTNTSGRFPTGRITNMMGLLGSRDYCDSNLVGVRHTNPYTGSTVEIPSTHRQLGNGDNLVIIGNADSRARIADLRYCRGATILAPVGGSLRFVDCFGINVIGGHIEGDEHLRNSAALTVTRSQVRVVGTEIWSANATRANGLPIIQTIDVRDGTTVTDAFTELTLEGVISRGVYRIASSGGSVVDEAQVPDLTLTSMNVNSKIRARGYVAATTISDQLQVNRIAPLVSSPVADIQAAINAGAGIIATGYWDLLRVDGAWKVVSVGQPDIVAVVARVNAPTPGDVIRNTAIPGAVAGGTYNYYFAELDEAGGMSKRTVAAQIVQSAATSTVRLDITLRRPGRVIVWRQLQGQPIDRCAIFGTDTTKLFLYDTGTNISKRPWMTSGYPERPAETTTSTSVDSLKFNNRTVTLA